MAGANKTFSLPIHSHSLRTSLQVCCSTLLIAPLPSPVGELMNGLGFLRDFYKGSVWAQRSIPTCPGRVWVAVSP